MDYFKKFLMRRMGGCLQAWELKLGPLLQTNFSIALQVHYAEIKLSDWFYFFKKWANPGLFSVYFRLFNMLQFKLKFKLKKA